MVVYDTCGTGKVMSDLRRTNDQTTTDLVGSSIPSGSSRDELVIESPESKHPLARTRTPLLEAFCGSKIWFMAGQTDETGHWRRDREPMEQPAKRSPAVRDGLEEVE